jgi:type IV pilus assembly protein PilP
MFRHRLHLILVALAALSLLYGCGEETPAPSPPSPPQKVAAPPPVQPAPAPAAETAAEAAAPRYVYDPAERRDPFEPLTLVRKPLAAQDAPLTPLQRFDLGQLRLIGVIVGKGEPRAMVVAPDGKSYILKKGVKVGRNDGKIVDITAEAILVEERYYDFSGEIRKSTQEIQLPKREGVE